MNAIDTLGFKLDGDESLSSKVWSGVIAMEITFGDHKGPIAIQMNQVELANGNEVVGLDHSIDTNDYDGMLAFSLTVNFRIAFEREGDYRYDFFLNGVKRGETALRVRAVRD